MDEVTTRKIDLLVMRQGWNRQVDDLPNGRKILQGLETSGSELFFKRGERDRGNAKKLFPTIIRQLTAHIPQLIPFVQRTLSDEPEITDKSLREQFEKLVFQPLLSLGSINTPTATVVIVIDALDESERDDEMRIIFQCLSQLRYIRAVPLRVFLTSRPEWPILQEFAKITRERECLILHEVPELVIRHDICLFLEHRLSAIRLEHSLPNDWPTESDFQNLVDLSVPLFIFAATACRLLEDPNFNARESLKEVLAHRNVGSDFDGTYLPVLSRLLKGQNKRRQNLLIQDFQDVVGAIVMLESPLPVVSLSKLLSRAEEQVSQRLRSLYSVLDIPSDPTQPVRMFHLSFRDFLLDPETRAKTPFGVDEERVHYMLTNQCLLVCQKLRKNICQLPSDGTYRTEINQHTIDSQLPPELQYACRYWAYHLLQCTISDDVICVAYIFLQKHFLHWLEAMSLLGLLGDVLEIINNLQRVMPVSPTRQSYITSTE